MVIALWSFANLAQEFEIPVTAIPGVPDNVVQAALGGPHRVVVPQRQRLLVAANKATEASKEAAGTAAPNTGTKAKPKAKSKAVAKPKAGAKATPASTAETKAKRAPYADTEYHIQRKAFFATLLI